MKILIISSNLIGDTILSTGVINYFMKKNKLAKFTFIIGPTAGQIYQNFPNLDKIISIKKQKFNLHWLEIYRNCYKTKWDIIVDLRSSFLSFFLSHKKKFIFKKDKNLHHLDQFKKFFKINNSELIIHNNKFEQDKTESKLDKNKKYIVIFPGGNWKPKIWPSEYYNKLIKLLDKNYKNICFIFVGSSSEEKKYLDKISIDLPKEKFINLMGETLTQTSSYMKKSDLFIGNDSGLMHLSFASNLKTVCLFGPTNDKVYGHTNENCFIIRTKEDYSYFKKIYLNKEKSYMESIKPESILQLIKSKNLL